jgi:hypothetical protein
MFFEDDNNPILTPNSRGKKRIPGTKDLISFLNSSDPEFIRFIEVSFLFNVRLVLNGTLKKEFLLQKL